MPEPELVVGDMVIHRASGEPAVVIEIIDEHNVRVSFSFNHECLCCKDALERNGN